MATDRIELSEQEWKAERERDRRRFLLSEEIEACILMLARLAVEVQRGTAGDGAAKLVSEVKRLVEKYRAEQAKPAHDWLTDHAIKEVAKVYTRVSEARAAPAKDAYRRLLTAALRPMGIVPTDRELSALAQSPAQIRGKLVPGRPGSEAKNLGKHTGPKAAANRALAPYIDKMLARRRGHPVTGEPSDEARAMFPRLVNGSVGTTTLQKRQKAARDRGELAPEVASADARAYLAAYSGRRGHSFQRDLGTRSRAPGHDRSAATGWSHRSAATSG
jgi:hypothetical protein